MTQGTAATFFDAIISYLRESNLQWLINQVQEEIERGKVVIKAVKDINFKEGEQLKDGRFKGSKDVVSTSEPYTDTERLEILLNAIEELLNVNAIEKSIFENLKSVNSQIEEIVFLNEENGNSTYTISQRNIQHENDIVDSLLSEIREMRNNIK